MYSFLYFFLNASKSLCDVIVVSATIMIGKQQQTAAVLVIANMRPTEVQ